MLRFTTLAFSLQTCAEIKLSRPLHTDGTTKLEYTELLTSTIVAHNLRHGDRMTVRLLLSIDRSKSIDENAETLDMAVRMSSRKSVIVGIDFSGNPHNGRFDDFISMLKMCRDNGLFVTVHSAEIHDSTRNGILAFRKSNNTLEHEVAATANILTFSSSISESAEMDDIIAFR